MLPEPKYRVPGGRSTAYMVKIHSLYVWTVIFVSNPTSVEPGLIVLRLELSWGFDNTIFMIEQKTWNSTKPNHTNLTKPNQAKQD